MTTKPRSEAEISARIQLLASALGFRLWRNQSGKYKTEDGRWISSGLFPGAPDLVGVGPGGRFLAVEVKRPGQKPRPNQQAAIDTLRSLGAICGVCCSEEDFLLMLKPAPVDAAALRV